MKAPYPDMLGKFVDSFERTPDSNLRLPPRTVTDTEGRDIWLRAYDSGDFEGLTEMYAEFDTTQRAQGIPPMTESSIRDWLLAVLDGPSVVAEHDGDIVGHVMFVPDDDAQHELAIFVHHAYQSAGVGTELIRTGLGHAQTEGVTDVWLQVGGSNVIAQKLYQKVDFRFDQPTGSSFRMSRRL